MKQLKKLPPLPIREITTLALPKYCLHRLDNGIPVYEVCAGTQDIIKLEITFRAGRPFEQKHLASRATARLLREGTKHRQSADIAEAFDFYGTSLVTTTNLDTSSIIFSCLKKHFHLLLPIVAEIIFEPTFPEQELQTFINNNKQRLQVDLQKSDAVAYRKITALIFGENHPYGYNSTADTYNALTQNDLITHWNNTYAADNCQIFIAGRTDETILTSLNTYFGQFRKQATNFAPPIIGSTEKPHKMLIKNNADSVQAAIRIGRHLFNRQHPNYKKMYVLNTVLGGYFSSRLMSNIREAKGFTYNIYSMLDPMLFDGYFYIGAEVSHKFVSSAIKEIHKEIKKLQTELIGADELMMVRNYLMGGLLAMIDGPFNTIDVIRTLATEDIPLTHYEDTARVIRSITTEDLLEMARLYLNKDDLWEVIAK